VVLASAVVVALAGLLVTRVLAPAGSAGAAERAPAATVPEPRAVEITSLELPCWACPSQVKEWPVRFRTDLDLVAPLGDGAGNAAEYFVDFTKETGPRAAEAEAAMAAQIDGPDWIGNVLPTDHPLLAEAAPWCDQSTMRFYPDLLALDGYATRIPNLLLMLKLARSWAARGAAATSTTEAEADFRRAVRLGRLLRQEDVTIIADLVGIACIRAGVEGIYRRAIADGNLERALVAAVVFGELAPQRLLTSERITAGNLSGFGRVAADGRLGIEMPDARIDRLAELIRDRRDRRFGGEALIGLYMVRHLGSEAQQARVTVLLRELTGDPDPIVAAGARWALEAPLDERLVTETFMQD
jgi:hypothetical protein